MILTITISVVLSNLVTFGILHYIGKKQKEKAEKEIAQLEKNIKDNLNNLTRNLEAAMSMEVEEDFPDFLNDKDDKKILH